VPARPINIKYITIRAEKVASPVTALHGDHLSFADIFGTRKPESLSYRVALFAWSYV